MSIKLSKKLIATFESKPFRKKTKSSIMANRKSDNLSPKNWLSMAGITCFIFCSNILISWNTVYYHFRKWSKDESWKQMWIKLLSLYKTTLDMSPVQLDGSHTPAKRGGEAVANQHRKKFKNYKCFQI